MLKKQNMHLKQYGKKIVRMALEETKYEPVLTLFTSRNVIVFSEEPQVAKLLKLKKRMPQFILMGKYASGFFWCLLAHLNVWDVILFFPFLFL